MAITDSAILRTGDADGDNDPDLLIINTSEILDMVDGHLHVILLLYNL
jgi:hypothetical protein